MALSLYMPSGQRSRGTSRRFTPERPGNSSAGRRSILREYRFFAAPIWSSTSRYKQVVSYSAVFTFSPRLAPPLNDTRGWHLSFTSPTPFLSGRLPISCRGCQPVRSSRFMFCLKDLDFVHDSLLTTAYSVLWVLSMLSSTSPARTWLAA